MKFTLYINCLLLNILSACSLDTPQSGAKAARKWQEFICHPDLGLKLHLKLDTVLSDQGYYSVGMTGKCSDGDRVKFKVGDWKGYFKTHRVRFEGEYALGLVRNCCSFGYCYSQYVYRIGHWIYYYENGQIEADITYLIQNLPEVNPTCGDTIHIKTPRISKTSRFYDEKGNILTLDAYLREAYEKDTTGIITF